MGKKAIRQELYYCTACHLVTERLQEMFSDEFDQNDEAEFRQEERKLSECVILALRDIADRWEYEQRARSRVEKEGW